jgi:hypothetical protein
MLRILVTGSRDWTDRDLIEKKLLEHSGGRSDIIIVHGACPRGADLIADYTAARFGWIVERHPANWREDRGKSAGYIRNVKMVKLGADVCVAFIKNGSKGATMCANLAEKAGIPTERVIV